MSADWIDDVRWDDNGLIPAIAQDAANGQVLMVAWMDRDALKETVKTERVRKGSCQFQIKPGFGAVPVHARQQDFTRACVLHAPPPFNGVYTRSLAPAVSKHFPPQR